MIKASKKIILKKIFYLQININKIYVLLDFGNEVNTITLAYISKLNLKLCYTNIGAQKIDCSILKIFEIVLASFWIKNKLKKPYFF